MSGIQSSSAQKTVWLLYPIKQLSTWPLADSTFRKGPSEGKTQGGDQYGFLLQQSPADTSRLFGL